MLYERGSGIVELLPLLDGKGQEARAITETRRREVWRGACLEGLDLWVRKPDTGDLRGRNQRNK